MRFYAGPRLLIVDEVGYLPLAGEAAAALFQVVSQRYLKGSIALTTNLGVGARGRIFNDDPMVAAAMLDRRSIGAWCSTSTASPTACGRTGARPEKLRSKGAERG